MHGLTLRRLFSYQLRQVNAIRVSYMHVFRTCTIALHTLTVVYKTVLILTRLPKLPDTIHVHDCCIKTSFNKLHCHKLHTTKINFNARGVAQFYHDSSQIATFKTLWGHHLAVSDSQLRELGSRDGVARRTRNAGCVLGGDVR